MRSGSHFIRWRINIRQWERSGNHFVVTFDDRGGVPTVPFDGAVAFDGRGGVAAISFNVAVPFDGGGGVTAVSFDSVVAFNGG